MTRRENRPRRGEATGSPAQPAAGGRWRLRNWRLRTKLLVVLLIPTLTLVGLVGLRIKADLDQSEEYAELITSSRLERTVLQLVHDLQRERDVTVRLVAASRAAGAPELRSQRDQVNLTVGRFERELSGSRSRLSVVARDGFGQVQQRLDVLTGLRFAADHAAYPADAVLRAYSELISGLLDVGDRTVPTIADPQLAGMRLATNALARIADQMSIKRALLAESIEQRRLAGDRMRALLAADAELAAARKDFQLFATPEQRRMYEDTVIGQIVDSGNDMVESALSMARRGQPLTGLDAVTWDNAATSTVNLVYRVQDAVVERTQQLMDDLAAKARRSALADAGLVLGVLLVAGILATIIARSLVRPLRTLRRSALEVADHRLPAAVSRLLTAPVPGAHTRIAPVPVYSREELGEVARAFDAVHGEAVRLAGEQALLRENVNSMFVNLSKRSQELVERQLSVLDRMEAEEQDPDTLGGLFELDHLATRMRRVSENLLVLAGNDVGREVVGEVAVDELVTAALSEVEHYQRIEVYQLPPVAVHGEAAGDLVHVLSELLENATDYSPPTTPVLLASALTEDAALRVDITDHGAGMPEVERDRANARLADPAEVDVEVSRRMGLYVVAKLARRHGIRVWLREAETGGLTATVLVPAELVRVLPSERPVLESTALGVAEAAAEPVVPAGDRPGRHAGPEEVEEVEEPVKPAEPVVPAEPAEPSEAPRRAPVEGTPEPVWPVASSDEYLAEMDEPTVRMPKYEELVAQWFPPPSRDTRWSGPPIHWETPVEPEPVAAQAEPEEPAPVEPELEFAEPINGELDLTDAGLEPTPPEVPGPAPAGPEPVAPRQSEPVRSVWTEPEAVNQPRPAPPVPEAPEPAEPQPWQGPEPESDAEITLPQRIPAQPTGPRIPGHPRYFGAQRIPAQPPTVSFAPEAVRERMTSLQEGRRRARDLSLGG